jgi:fucose permease
MSKQVESSKSFTTSAKPYWGVDAAVHIVFVLAGVVTTVLGPLIPLLVARRAVSSLQAGYLFTAQFLGSLAGAGLSSLLLARFGFRRPIEGGLILMGAGVAALWFCPWPKMLWCVASYGVGLGLVIPGSNLFIAELHWPRPAPALNTLNFAWGLGAAVSSLWVGALVTMGTVGAGLAALGFLIAGLPILTPLGQLPAQRVTTSCATRFGPRQSKRQLSVSLAIGLLFYLYVGIETSVGGWVATYAHQVAHLGQSAWILAPGFFWGALLSGRALAPVLLKKISDQTLMLAELPVAALGIALLLAAQSVGGILATATVAGIGLAAVYPGTISLLSLHSGATARQSGGAMFGLSALGGASLPWLVGYVAARTGKFQFGLAIPLAGVLAMWVVFIAIARVSTAGGHPRMKT